jgi:20S proteasome subunit beta 4
MADTLFGFKGADFSLVATDTSQTRSIMVFKQDEDKTYQLEPNKVIGLSGPNADRTAFGEYICKNIALYNLRTGLKQSCHATANYMSTELAAAMRKGPYQVNTILAGFDAPGAGEDKDTPGKPALYWLDYMGALQDCNFGVHGYAASFLLSVFDSGWKVRLVFSRSFYESFFIFEKLTFIFQCISLF